MLKNNNGFTLIEMLIVLMIISVLIILIVPNLSEKTKDVHAKGCDALVSVVQSQVEAYSLDHGEFPQDLDELVTENYLSENQKSCKGNLELDYNSSTGLVTVPEVSNE